MSFWSTVNQAQATIIAAFLTIIAAAVGVLLGASLFNRQVRNIKEALATAEQALNDHQSRVGATVKQTAEMVEIEFKGIQESVQLLRASVADLQQTMENNLRKLRDPEPLSPIQIGQTNVIEDNRQRLADEWSKIRGKLEQILQETPDGRTRAKYNRIDRRNYGEVIRALGIDGRLQNNLTLFEEAEGIWRKYRNGRTAPTTADIEKLKGLAAVIGAQEDD